MNKVTIPTQRRGDQPAKPAHQLTAHVSAAVRICRSLWASFARFPRKAVVAGFVFGLFWLVIEAFLPQPNLMVTPAQQGIFIGMGVVESVIAGFAAAWLWRMYQPLKQLGDRLITFTYTVLCLMVASWRLHDILHARIDMSGAHMEAGTWQLIGVEMMFHFTSAVFGALVLVVLSKLILEKLKTTRQETVTDKTNVG